MLIYVAPKCWVNLNNCSHWFLHHSHENLSILVHLIFGVARPLSSLAESSWTLLWSTCHLVALSVSDLEYVGACRRFSWVSCRLYLHVFVSFGDVSRFHPLLALCLGCIKMFTHLE